MNAVPNRNSPKLHKTFERNQKVFLAASFAKSPFPKNESNCSSIFLKFLKRIKQ